MTEAEHIRALLHERAGMVAARKVERVREVDRVLALHGIHVEAETAVTDPPVERAVKAHPRKR